MTEDDPNRERNGAHISVDARARGAVGAIAIVIFRLHYGQRGRRAPRGGSGAGGGAGGRGKISEFDPDSLVYIVGHGIARNRLLKYYRSHARDRIVLSETALIGSAKAGAHRA